MTDFSDLSEPAQRHLSTASERLDRLAAALARAAEVKAQVRQALPPALADQVCALVDNAAARGQDIVHEGRANLAHVAELDRAEQRAQQAEEAG